MNLIDIATELGIGAGVGVGIIIVLSLIQISPIEVNPWSRIGHIMMIPFKTMGKAITADLTDRIDKLSRDMQDISDNLQKVNSEVGSIKIESEEDKAVQRRIRILRFGDDIRSGRPHSLEHFDEILHDISEYQNYCDEHPKFENSRAVMTIKCIESDYQEHLLKNDFL